MKNSSVTSYTSLASKQCCSSAREIAFDDNVCLLATNIAYKERLACTKKIAINNMVCHFVFNITNMGA